MKRYCHQVLRFLIVFLVAASVGGIVPSSHAADNSLERRFLDEAPKGWAALEAANDKLDVTGVVIRDKTTGSLAGLGKMETRNFRYASDLPDSFLYKAKIDAIPGINVFAANPRYSFNVIEFEDKRKTTINYYGPDRKSLEYIIRVNVNMLAGVSYCHRETEFASIIKDPGFKIHQVSEHAGDGPGFIKLDFEFLSANKGLPRIPQGWAVFDPQHNWALRESDAIWANGPPYHMVTHVEYDMKPGDPIPTPKSVEYVTFIKSVEEGSATTRCDFTSFRREAPSPGEFKMTAFGLPELADLSGDGPTGFRPELWVLGLGIVLGIAAVVFRVRSRSVA